MLSDNGTVKVRKTGLSFVERQVMSGTCSPIKHSQAEGLFKSGVFIKTEAHRSFFIQCLVIKY